MGSVNTIEREYTHGGTLSSRITPEEMLRRSVLSCFLWEKEFYEDGKSIVERIKEYAGACSPGFVYELAMEARHIHGLRHVPLLLLLSIINRKGLSVIDLPDDSKISVKHAIKNVIRRPDEMGELISLYWLDKKKVGTKVFNKMSDRQLRDGLKLAFEKFDEYSLAKYDNPNKAVKIRDVMFLAHPKPRNEEQAQLFKRVAEKKLVTPNTWEVLISGAGKDTAKRKEIWETLLRNTVNPDWKDRDNALGYMALLRNLRNMVNDNVNIDLIREAILLRKGADLVLPFRYVAAARACPQLEPVLDQSLLEGIKKKEPLPGRTIVLVDCSGSMRGWVVSERSDIDRVTAAATLASIIHGEEVRVFSFANKVMELPHRMGMAGVDSIIRSQNGGTNLSGAITKMNNYSHNRLIVITDEQDTTGRPIPAPKCEYPYMINVASARNGVGYGRWIHLDGFSEGIIRFIYEFEKMVRGK